jgi:hypothetical protein
MKPIQTSTRRLFAASIITTILGAGASQAATVAYYRFEDGTAGSAIGSNAATDSAGTSHFSGFPTSGGNAPTFSATVPAGTVPQTGAPNTRSASLNGTADIFDPNQTTSTISVHVFTNFTIEAYVNFRANASKFLIP